MADDISHLSDKELNKTVSHVYKSLDFGIVFAILLPCLLSSEENFLQHLCVEFSWK